MRVGCGKVVRAWLCASGAGGLSFLGLCLAAPPASGQSGQPQTEIFTGLEVSDNYASVYVGAGTALGKGLYEPGFRLRAVGSFGRYHYDGTLLTGGDYVPTTFDGEDTFLAALAGYQFRQGAFIAKLFAGIEGEDQHISPHDPNNKVQGSELGLRPGSTSRRGCSSRPTHLTAQPSRNIARSRESAFACARVLRLASKAARSATRNMVPGRAAVSFA